MPTLVSCALTTPQHITDLKSLKLNQQPSQIRSNHDAGFAAPMENTIKPTPSSYPVAGQPEYLFITPIKSFIANTYPDDSNQIIRQEILSMTGIDVAQAATADSIPNSAPTSVPKSIPTVPNAPELTYGQLQNLLSTWNERETVRKRNGVYYTPTDVVDFITQNCFKLFAGSLTPANICDLAPSNTSVCQSFSDKLTVFDPTCGAGEFLLAALEIKLNILQQNTSEINNQHLLRIAATIAGNDINPASTTIAMLRLYLAFLHRFGPNTTVGLGSVLRGQFRNVDYISNEPASDELYDIILGNPPYVEDRISGLTPTRHFGNIYANVVDNALSQLSPGGVFGFILPISYVSTPRMAKIRERVSCHTSEQYIFNFADRPDSLFSSVHQKLSIILAKDGMAAPAKVFTGNYTYWYKEERSALFQSLQVVENPYCAIQFIPKLGSPLELDIYHKITAQPIPLGHLVAGEPSIGSTDADGGNAARKGMIYLNSRATFWIKAFINQQPSLEYQAFPTLNNEISCLAMCYLNSSLFWWYWVCVSDCWHLTKKELLGFRVPKVRDYSAPQELATKLEGKLETTKVHVGTKQTLFEYKHKLCLAEISAIDNYVNDLFGLTPEQSAYIMGYASRYRQGAGAVR